MDVEGQLHLEQLDHDEVRSVWVLIDLCGIEGLGELMIGGQIALVDVERFWVTEGL